MRNELIIGDNTFASKKEALKFYKDILNSYDFGDKLSSIDFKNVCELLKLHQDAKDKIGIGILEIMIVKGKFNSKCFNLIRTDASYEIFSYNKCINGDFSPLTKFSRACREIVYNDLRNTKLEYFKNNSKNGIVKCQETGELCKWEELNIDHRQPNTFSVIVDRFIEVYKIDINTIEYVEKEDNVFTFIDDDLIQNFRQYHKDKSNLRLVKKCVNLSRSHQARINIQKKDLRIKS